MQATVSAMISLSSRYDKGASPGEVFGVLRVNGEDQVVVRVPPGSKPGKVRWLKVQVPRTPGSKVSFEYDAEYVPPDGGTLPEYSASLVGEGEHDVVDNQGVGEDDHDSLLTLVDIALTRPLAESVNLNSSPHISP